MPSGMLTAAAKKGSIAARMSTWVGLKAYHLMRKGASAENIPQTAKPSENARNDIHKTLGLPGGSAVTSTSIAGFSTASFLQKHLFARILPAHRPCANDKAPASSLHRRDRTSRRRRGILLGIVRFERIVQLIEKTGRSR